MNLKEFLVKAKKATYASSTPKAETLPDGRKRLIYEADKYKYEDIYYGFNPFMGSENVYFGEKLIWHMEYAGGTTSKPEETYKFLKQALSQVTVDAPYRGPKMFQNSNYKYLNEIVGSINKFVGTEVILLEGEKIYELTYKGGKV